MKSTKTGHINKPIKIKISIINIHDERKTRGENICFLCTFFEGVLRKGTLNGKE